MKKHLHFYLISFCSLCTFLALQAFDPAVINDYLESKTYDLRLQLRNVLRGQPKPDNIVVVAIDEKSIAEIGRWPWSRSVQAKLVDKIAAGHPKVIGIDIMYSERENPQSDGELARAVKQAGNVVLATAFLLPEPGETLAKSPTPPDFLWDSAFLEVKAVPGINWRAWAVKPKGINPPISELANGVQLGHATNQPDLDGVLRWDIMTVNVGEDCYPSLPLQVARIAAGLPMKQMSLLGGSGVRFGDHVIHTDLSGRVLVNYLGREKTFPYISACDLLSGRVAPEQLRDRIVFVGTSALATYDQKVTPFSADMPGVEKNANVVQNILHNNFIRKSPGVFEMVSIVVASLILILVLPRLKAMQGVTIGLGLISVYFVLSCALLIYSNIWINLLYPSLNMLIILATETTTKLFIEERRAKEIRAMFSSYVTERLVNEMIKHPEMARLGGEKRTVTVLFSDVKGFTTYSENHGPEAVVSILNEYLGEMTEVVLRWEGILDKFIGDAIVVFWGAPMEQEDHAERAVGCALEMQARLTELRVKWAAEGKTPLDSGIGINTGEAIVGNIGAEGKKMDYTVIGDHVNLGARVEGLTRRYQTNILMTEYTLERLRPLLTDGRMQGIAVTGMERVIVKGKDTPVGIFAVSPLDPGTPSVIVECDQEKVVRLTEK